jgi:hypothetical protein
MSDEQEALISFGIKWMHTTSVSNGRFSMTLMLTAEKRPIADEQLKEIEETEDTHREKLAHKSSMPRSLLKTGQLMPTSTRCRSYHPLESLPRQGQVK